MAPYWNAWFQSGAQNEQDEPKTSCHIKKESYQWLPDSCQKDSRANLNKLPLAKDETIWGMIKVIPATDWNTSDTLYPRLEIITVIKTNNTQKTQWSPLGNARKPPHYFESEGINNWWRSERINNWSSPSLIITNSRVTKLLTRGVPFYRNILANKWRRKKN